MKTNKIFACGIFAVIIALAFIACPAEKTPENDPPTANAGTDQTVTLASNLTITLNGTDSTGNSIAYAWECESYTADQGTVSAVYSKAQVDALITNASTATASVAPRKAGTYVFRLTVTGDEGESDTDNVTVVVKPMIDARNLTTTQSTFNASTSLDIIVPSFNNVSAMWDGFNLNDITWTLTSVSPSVDLSTYATNKQAIPVSAYGDDTEPTITQVFMYKGVVIGQRVIETQTGTGHFDWIKIGNNNYDVIPSLSLPVIRDVPEL